TTPDVPNPDGCRVEPGWPRLGRRAKPRRVAGGKFLDLAPGPRWAEEFPAALCGLEAVRLEFNNLVSVLGWPTPPGRLGLRKIDQALHSAGQLIPGVVIASGRSCALDFRVVLSETAVMQGKPKVIALLNEALQKELTAITQYFLHAEMCENWHYDKLGGYIKKLSIVEMKHVEALIERILFLDSTPNLTELLKLS